jgi:hypothetical protein
VTENVKKGREEKKLQINRDIVSRKEMEMQKGKKRRAVKGRTKKGIKKLA